VLHAARWKYRTQKWRKNRHLRTIAQLCRAVSSQLRHVSTIGKKMLNSNTSSKCPYNIENFGPLNEICSGVWGTPANFNGFTSWLRYCSDAAHRTPTKLCTTFGRLLGWYTMYTFSGARARWRNFARCKIHFTFKSCVLLYWQRYCTALQQRAWAKLYGVVQGMELRNFRRRRHLYSAERPSRWASAHIIVLSLFLLFSSRNLSGRRLSTIHGVALVRI